MQTKTERQENARKLRVKNLNQWMSIQHIGMQAATTAVQLIEDINKVIPGFLKNELWQISEHPNVKKETLLAFIQRKIKAHKEDIMRLNLKLNNDRHDFN